MKKIMAITIVAIAICISTSAFAWFGGGKVLTVEEMQKPQTIQKLDQCIYNRLTDFMMKADAGDFEGKPEKGQVAFMNVFKKGLEDAGFSFEDTLQYILSKRDKSFWAITFHNAGYGDIFMRPIGALESPDVSRNLIKNNVISKETYEMYLEYQKWITNM